MKGIYLRSYFTKFSIDAGLVVCELPFEFLKMLTFWNASFLIPHSGDLSCLAKAKQVLHSTDIVNTEN